MSEKNFLKIFPIKNVCASFFDVKITYTLTTHPPTTTKSIWNKMFASSAFSSMLLFFVQFIHTQVHRPATQMQWAIWWMAKRKWCIVHLMLVFIKATTTHLPNIMVIICNINCNIEELKSFKKRSNKTKSKRDTTISSTPFVATVYCICYLIL